MFKYLFIMLLLTACTSGVESTDLSSFNNDEDVANIEQSAGVGVCGIRPIHTFFHEISTYTVTVPAACNGIGVANTYSTSEPRIWRIDEAAPAPKKTTGSSCVWLAPAIQYVDLTTNLCTYRQFFKCNWGGGPLIYDVKLTETGIRLGPDWEEPEMVMGIADPVPGGGAWYGPDCPRTLKAKFWPW